MSVVLKCDMIEMVLTLSHTCIHRSREIFNRNSSRDNVSLIISRCLSPVKSEVNNFDIGVVGKKMITFLQT